MRSGSQVVSALSAAGVEAVAVDWDGTLGGALVARDFDRCFIALHGRGGEDGQIQAVLDLMDIPYTGTRVLGCALAMDKARAKLAWLGAGLPTPAFEVVDEQTDVDAMVARIGLPLVIKPVREGSSYGVSIVKRIDDVEAALKHARVFDAQVLAERYIDGAEYTLSIVADSALPMIKLETAREFYDYEAKYVSDDTRYICPCGLAPRTERDTAEIALRAFEVLDGRSWGRVDFMRDADGVMWLIELNTVPGMTDHSLVPMAALEAGLSFQDLVLAILASSMKPGDLR